MYPVYQGVARKRGDGLGDMLKSAYRTVVPVLKPMVTRRLHALKDAALTHGKEFLQNVIIDKQNPKEAFLRAGKNVLLQTGKDILARRETPINATIAAESDIPVSLQPQQGQGRKRRRRKHPFRGLHTLKARKTKKRKTVRDLDVFDY
jgi:hypothetical protein